jgi:hypothetical protein
VSAWELNPIIGHCPLVGDLSVPGCVWVGDDRCVIAGEEAPAWSGMAVAVCGCSGD